MVRYAIAVGLVILSLQRETRAQSFAVDSTPPPATHPALAPADGAIATTNPPSLIWRHDATAESYVVEFAPTREFTRDVVRVTEVPMPFYNHDQTLAIGTWFWRYRVVRQAGLISEASPVRSFRVTGDSVALPIPSMPTLLAALPGHPRIFTRPEALEEFRTRRHGAGREAWENIRAKADAVLALQPVVPKLLPLAATLPDHRQQVFFVEQGVARVPENYRIGELGRDAERANLLSLAWLVSGEERYARAARAWALFVAPFRVDFHLQSVAARGQHDSVVYAYEKGITAIAFTYDRLAGMLPPEERRALLEHVEYHGEAAYHWLRDVMKIHLEYQDSHAQQCMHALLPAALATAGDSAPANTWLSYLVPQYANRVAWMSDDGGYFEGQSYSFKFTYILEALAALRPATGIDLFQKPAIRNAGDFWLYCMSLNYWWPHGGDNLPLINPYGNLGDAYLSAMLAASTGNRPVQWWSDAVPADPNHVTFGYLAATGVRPQPPVAIAQAKAFRDTGQVSVYARFYDHGAPRIFFRSSPWGGDSHAHADQNSFVLHAGGEILAADVGYYTYFGDEHYDRVSTQTIAHNSILVDGKGQSNDLAGKGAITAFFNAPDYVFFAGDASEAYGTALNRFRRDVLYVRPGLFVLADELRAPVPSAWSWVLNTFEAPAVDAPAREFVVTQRGEQLWGCHVFPETLSYTSGNERTVPFFTRQWVRYTEAFPEPWRMQATTAKSKEMDFLTVLQTHPHNRAGARVQVAKALQTATTSAVSLSDGVGYEDVLLRRKQDSATPLAAWALQSDGRAFSVKRGAAGEVRRWVAIAARAAAVEGRELFHASAPIEIAVTHGTAAAAMQIWTQAAGPTELSVVMPRQPKQIVAFAPNRFEAGSAVPVRWSDGVAKLTVPEGGRVFWVDPPVETSTLPKRVTLHLQDDTGTQVVELETAIAENGDWIGHTVLSPRVLGIYEVSSSDQATEILVQDRWDPERTSRGIGRVTGLVSAGAEVILRFPPSATLPEFSARLVEARAAAAINLVRNGDCEAGLAHYPPRGWTIRRGANGEFASEGKQGWAEWSRESAASGTAALKFTRPLNRMTEWKAPFRETARDTLAVAAPPVRLLAGGRYLLALKARGTATHARVHLVAATGSLHTIELVPSAEWRDYHLPIELPPGFTEIKIHFRAGGADDQILWVDDVFLAPAN